jgi:hypothetical protein
MHVMTRAKRIGILVAVPVAAAIALPGSAAVAGASGPSTGHSAAAGKGAGTHVVAERRTHKPKKKPKKPARR